MGRRESDVKVLYGQQIMVNAPKEPLGYLYTHLYSAWFEMTRDYGDYRTLMAIENIHIFQEYAGDFAWRLHKALIDSVLLQMFRITDPKGKKGRENITIRALPDLLNDHDKRITKPLVNEAIGIIEPMRHRYRNKVAVHFDQNYQASFDTYDTKAFTMSWLFDSSTVEKAIYAISDVLKHVSNKVDNLTVTEWDVESCMDGSRAEKLIENLRSRMDNT